MLINAHGSKTTTMMKASFDEDLRAAWQRQRGLCRNKSVWERRPLATNDDGDASAPPSRSFDVGVIVQAASGHYATKRAPAAGNANLLAEFDPAGFNFNKVTHRHISRSTRCMSCTRTSRPHTNITPALAS